MFGLATSTDPSTIHDLLWKRGLSKLGRGLSSRCRRSSADLRGGGGEGGLKAGFEVGDVLRSLLEGRLGILYGLAGLGVAMGLTTSSGFKKDPSLPPMLGERPFGGECGGSTVSSGASSMGRGVSGGGGNALRKGERSTPFSFCGGGARPGFFGIGGGSFMIAVASGSDALSERGPGEAFRLDG